MRNQPLRLVLFPLLACLTASCAIGPQYPFYTQIPDKESLPIDGDWRNEGGLQFRIEKGKMYTLNAAKDGAPAGSVMAYDIRAVEPGNYSCRKESFNRKTGLLDFGPGEIEIISADTLHLRTFSNPKTGYSYQRPVALTKIRLLNEASYEQELEAKTRRVGAAAGKTGQARQPASRLPGSTITSTGQSTRERFTVDIVVGDKAQMKAAQLPEAGAYFAENMQYGRGPSGQAKFTSIFVVGNYLVQVEPATRRPLRLTLFGLGDPLSWSIDNPVVAELAASGREAFLDFRADGNVKIVVRSAGGVAFRIGAYARVLDGEKGKVWEVRLLRENEAGETLDIYGQASGK